MMPADPVAEESLALAGIASASVLGGIALGRGAGARVVRLGGEPNAPWVTYTGSRRAHLEGFDLYMSLPRKNRLS